MGGRAKPRTLEEHRARGKAALDDLFGA
jgi:hypothetical protein